MDAWSIFLQYVLPVIVASGVAGLTAWASNRRTQKKEDIDYWKESAKDLRVEFDKLRSELAEVKAQNMRYELAFMYIRNEPSSNAAVIRMAQAIIEGTVKYTRRKDDSGGDITEEHA